MTHRRIALFFGVLALIAASVAVFLYITERERVRTVAWTGDPIVIRAGV